MRKGPVSSRVALLLRSAEGKPYSPRFLECSRLGEGRLEGSLGPLGAEGLLEWAGFPEGGLSTLAVPESLWELPGPGGSCVWAVWPAALAGGGGGNFVFLFFKW